MFGTWLNTLDKKDKCSVLAGATTLCWAIWRCRNDVIFKNIRYISFMQALFRGTYWMRFWSQLQHNDGIKELFRQASMQLEVVAMEQANNGWKHNHRVADF